MNRRTKGILLIGCLAVATVVVLTTAPSVTLWVALTQSLDRNPCKISLRNLIIGCTFQSSSRTTSQSSPILATPSSATTIPEPSSPDTSEPRPIDETSWDVTDHCPLGDFAKRLLCRATSAAAPASDDLKAELSKATGLPLPKDRIVTTQKNSPFIKSVHVETPLNLAAVLGFYRVELGKRGWMENDGAVVEPDRAVIAFNTADGPALLRLIHQDDRTIADLSLRKPNPVEKADIEPNPGQVKLWLGNTTHEEAVITINGQTITLAARAGDDLTDDPRTGRKAPDSPEIDLAPGKVKVTLKVASGAAQNREFEIAADETWGLLVGPHGVPLPLRLY